MEKVAELVPAGGMDLEARLTGPAALEALGVALRDNLYVLTMDDAMVVASAKDLVISDAESYRQGWDLITGLDDIDKSIDAAHERFKKPLKTLTAIVQGGELPLKRETKTIRERLRTALGAWKMERDRLDLEETRRKQKAHDDSAKAAQQARSDTLLRVAKQESDPGLKQSFEREAAAVAAVQVSAAPVEPVSSVPADVQGFVRYAWKAKVVDVKKLMTAWVEGRCFLDGDAIVEPGVQTQLDVQAEALMGKLSLAYPGVEAVQVPIPVKKPRR